MTSIIKSTLERTTGGLKERSVEIEKVSKKIIADFETKKAVLLIGKVQSGKTTAFINVMASAINAGYRRVVVLTGTTNDLNDQTFDRIRGIYADKKTFQDKSGDYFQVRVFDKVNSTEINMNDEYRRIFVIKKGFQIKDIEIMDEEIKTLIIDDESDFASHNVAIKKKSDKNKEEKRSKTNDVLNKLTLKDFKYLAVTATPQSNILIRDKEFNSPVAIHIIKPGDGYNGLESFFANDFKGLKLVPEDEASIIRKDASIKTLSTLKIAVYTYILYVAAIREKMFNIESISNDESVFEKINMMINVDHSNEKHANIKDRIEYDIFCYCFDKQEVNRMKEMIMSELFVEQILSDMHLDYGIEQKQKLFNAFCKLDRSLFNIITLNSQSDNTSEISDTKYNIIIGGFKLSRGLTINNLVITYFIVDPKTKMADTTEQRARWFGYRKNFFDITKLFVTVSIKNSFASLFDIEKTLWDYMETTNAIDINEIRKIYAGYDDKGLKPTSTRKNHSKIINKGFFPVINNFSEGKYRSQQEKIFSTFQAILDGDQSVKLNVDNFYEIKLDVNILLEYIATANGELSSLIEELKALKEENINWVRLMYFRTKDGSYRYSSRKGEDANDSIERIEESYTAFGRGNNNSASSFVGDDRLSTDRDEKFRNIADLQIHQLLPNNKKFCFYKLYKYSNVKMYKPQKIS